MSYKSFLLVFGLVLAFDSSLPAQALFQKPVKVLGDPEFIGTASNPLLATDSGPNWVEGREFSFPAGVAVDSSVNPPNIYVADAGNNRVLGFRYATQLTAGAVADVVLGQVDRFSNLTSAQNGRSTGLSSPTAVAVDSSGNVYVADTNDNRIVRFPKPLSQQNGAPFPDMVIGQTSFTGRNANAGGISGATLALNTGSFTRSGIAFDSLGNLWVADTGNNRVLRFPAAVLQKGQNGPTADLVLGQADFVSRVVANSRTTKTNLSLPQALAFDTSARLLVGDGLSRVLVYGAAPVTNSVALRIMGVDATATTGVSQIALNGPLGLAATSAGIFVADAGNNRVLQFPVVDSWTAEAGQFSPTASTVIGQSNFTNNMANQGQADASASSFNVPIDVAVSRSEVFVADAQNNRVLVFSQLAGGVNGTAARVIGQLDFPFTAVNLIEGKEFFIAPSGSSANGDAILDQSVSPPHLYVADTQNNRILGFKDFTKVENGTKADIVIGQPDFHRSVVNYPSGLASQPGAQGLHLPSSLAVDSAGNLYVADTGNSRIVRFPAPFTLGQTALESADLVLGQANFTSIVTDPTSQTMSSPISIALTTDAANAAVANAGWLVAADNVHNRVLFFPKPFTSGMSATKVLGAQGFNTAAPASVSPPDFNSPNGVSVDTKDNVIVADTGNHRVQIFNKAANINNFDTPPISLTAGLNQPIAVSATATGFWVADFAQSRIFHYPTVDQLLLKSSASDASVPVNQPISAFGDSFGNLLAGDSLNRVLYYAPQVNVVNAANYSTRPLTQGAIVAVFPATGSSNTLASGTASFTTLPLPTTLASTQALVNLTPSPLFYVGPTQINLELSNSLSGSGAVDLRVVNQTTGQIFGGAELALTAASPALFTSNASGSGQIAAINVKDGSVNSALNPVSRGGYISLYGTGGGAVTGAPVDGQAAQGLAPTTSLPQVLIGSATSFLPDANVQYSGLAPGLVGVWQINVLIPLTAQTGSSVPIKVFLDSVPNIDPTSATAGNTTISIQ